MIEILKPIFTDEDKALEHLERLTWPNGPHCPHCGEVENVHRLEGKSHRKGLIQCNSCLKNFIVTVGTLFERSKIPLSKWHTLARNGIPGERACLKRKAAAPRSGGPIFAITE